MDQTKLETKSLSTKAFSSASGSENVESTALTIKDYNHQGMPDPYFEIQGTRGRPRVLCELPHVRKRAGLVPRFAYFCRPTHHLGQFCFFLQKKRGVEGAPRLGASLALGILRCLPGRSASARHSLEFITARPLHATYLENER